MKFTVIGMGRTGNAAIAYLLKQGAQVTAWNRDLEKLERFKKEGIKLDGVLQGVFFPNIFYDIGEAICGSQYILIFTTANGHRDIATALRNKLEPHQKIIIFNGNWGAVEFYTILKEEVKEKNIVICETGAQLFAANYVEKDLLFLKSMKNRIEIASIPTKEIDGILKELQSFFPQLVGAENVLYTSLSNSNPIVHCPINIFNLARIESGEPFLMYKSDYTSPLGVTYVEGLDRERRLIMERLGITPVSQLDIFNKSWGQNYKSIYEALKNIKSYQTTVAPISFDFRHFTEDIPFGIIPIQLLGNKYQIDTPYADALISLYSVALNKDFYKMTVDFDAFVLEDYLFESW